MLMPGNNSSPILQGISETLLMPLLIRAQESLRDDALLKDETAAELVRKLNYDFSHIKLVRHDNLALILRVREFDRFVRQFLAAHPKSVVIHIGCGLDTRFERVDNGLVTWYDMDLPAVINLRHQFMPIKHKRYHLLEVSVFDPNWINTVNSNHPTHILFLAEGVFSYFETQQVKDLVRDLRIHFPGSELVFDGLVPWAVKADNLHLLVSRMGARMHFGLKNWREVESWAEGIRLLEEWRYFGTDEPRSRPYRWLYRFSCMRNSAGIFHYRLGDPAQS
jgi:O-methyltransferase involved in polyketide biosynthesis